MAWRRRSQSAAAAAHKSWGGPGWPGFVRRGPAARPAARPAPASPGPPPPVAPSSSPLRVPFAPFIIPVGSVAGSAPGRARMSARCCRAVAMDLGVYQLRHFSISFLSSLLGTDSSSLRLDSR